jgi:acid phosphatase
VLSWDEDDYTEKNQILVSLLDPQGTIFAAGSQDNRPYNHYSLLATIERNWGLPSLGREDDKASVFVFQP